MLFTTGFVLSITVSDHQGIITFLLLFMVSESKHAPVKIIKIYESSKTHRMGEDLQFRKSYNSMDQMPLCSIYNVLNL